MDDICQAGENATHIPPEKHPAYYGNTNVYVLSRADLPTMYSLLRQRRLRWLGHVRRMEDGRIPKYILHGELALGRRTTGRPHLRYKDVCVRDMKAVDIETLSWKGLAADRTKWRRAHILTNAPWTRRNRNFTLTKSVFAALNTHFKYNYIFD